MSCLQLVTDCQSCPAVNLKSIRGYGHMSKAFPGGTNWECWVNYCENLRKNECIRILDLHGEIKLYLLTESIPYGRFIYDTNSNYHEKYTRSYTKSGLRTNLCTELINKSCPSNVNHCSDCPHLNELLEYLRGKGILIVDCAYCPLHKFKKQYNIRITAATICLNKYMECYLNISPNAQIITIFPARLYQNQNYRYFKRKKPHIDQRVIERFNFGDLDGLKKKSKNY